MIFRHILLPSGFIFFSFLSMFGQEQPVDKLSVVFNKEEGENLYVRDNRIFLEGWHTLPQVNFWKKVVTLPPDSGLLNVHASREVVAVISVKFWNLIPAEKKDSLRASVRNKLGLSPDEKIVFTTGKQDFYDFDHAVPIISKAFGIFEEQGIPAFYAQSILLIECPGKLKKSSAGAAGHFQLMPSVAVSMGLKVNKYVDERNDFVKCSQAAARFIGKVCIPRAENLLNERNIPFSKKDLWFKLLVLHVYHAGSGNVAAALDSIPTEKRTGKLNLITTLWQTKAASFGNASQNYSQIALANNLLLFELLENRCSELTVSPYQYAAF
jgi:hypothetical protein